MIFSPIHLLPGLSNRQIDLLVAIANPLYGFLSCLIASLLLSLKKATGTAPLPGKYSIPVAGLIKTGAQHRKIL
jgi:hypothetical protein